MHASLGTLNEEREVLRVGGGTGWEPHCTCMQQHKHRDPAASTQQNLSNLPAKIHPTGLGGSSGMGHAGPGFSPWH